MVRTHPRSPWPPRWAPRECEIFTDVPAVFTADPRVVPDARRLSSIRHEEMLEMAEAGAGVLQPRSVELALAHGVDIHLRSSFSTEQGTWIRREAGGFESTGSTDVAGIAHRRQESLYTVDGVGRRRGRQPRSPSEGSPSAPSCPTRRDPVHRTGRRHAEVTAALEPSAAR